MPTGGKNNWQKIFGSRWFLLVLLVVAIFVAVAYGRAYYRDYQVRQEIVRLQNEVKKLEAKKIETMEILQYVKSNNFIEEKARTELNLIKPGEKMVIVASGTKIGESELEKPKDYKQDLPNPVKWWRFFFGGLRDK
jgi:cell division protein FtsB